MCTTFFMLHPVRWYMISLDLITGGGHFFFFFLVVFILTKVMSVHASIVNLFIFPL